MSLITAGADPDILSGGLTDLPANHQNLPAFTTTKMLLSVGGGGVALDLPVDAFSLQKPFSHYYCPTLLYRVPRKGGS